MLCTSIGVVRGLLTAAQLCLMRSQPAPAPHAEDIEDAKNGEGWPDWGDGCTNNGMMFEFGIGFDSRLDNERHFRIVARP